MLHSRRLPQKMSLSFYQSQQCDSNYNVLIQEYSTIPDEKEKIENWGSEIRALEEKVEEIKQDDLDVLRKVNKKAVGKCFERENQYIKIISCFEGDLYCSTVNFGSIDLGVIGDVDFSSVKEIEETEYNEISLEVFDEQIKIKTREFMKDFFQIEE